MISVCIATYNGEKYIKEQLESILIQLEKTDEVIVSDDNSTDYTLKTIKSLNDDRIHIFMNSKGQGYTRNFENALEKARGDIIFLSDQDDVWMKDKVSKMLDCLKWCDFVVSNNKIVDEKLNVINRSHFDLYGTQKGFLQNLIRPRYVGACMAFRNKVLEKSLPFPQNFKLAAHDYWISLIAESYYKVCKIDEPLILYRRHDSNASSGGEKSQNSLKHKLMVRFYVLLHLMGRLYK